jgi:type 1 glutamine amidotransferase
MTDILLVLCGAWHDFDAFEAFYSPLAQGAGFNVKTARSTEVLDKKEHASHGLVVMYTCIGDKENNPSGLRLADNQADALESWVAAGGALLAIHAATVASQTSPIFKNLCGAEFVMHPPRFGFTVYPLGQSHPVTDGVGAFCVNDEFYVQSFERGVDVAMVAIDRGIAYPMVWTRRYGKGRVAGIAPGHDMETWQEKAYQRLLLQSASWLTQRPV